MKYRKRAQYEASQWFKHGDHIKVGPVPLGMKLSEFKQRKFGWLETPQGGHVVFPGDWIIQSSKGEWGTCNPITFARLYEPAEEEWLPESKGA